MGLWPARAAKRVSDVQASALDASETFPGTTNVYQITTGQPVEVGAVHASKVSRELAASVPAVLRGVTMLATTMAALPIERFDAAGASVDLGWMDQPEAGRARFATFNDLGQDLIYDGRAYLRVWERVNGEPKRGGCEYLKLSRVGNIIGADGRPTITVDGTLVDRANVIGFTGWNEGILTHGARIIRTAVALEAAARRYADTPLPAVTLVNKSGVQLDDEEIDKLVVDYKRGRNQEGVGYVNDAVDVIPTSFDSAQLQLVEARQFVSTQLANLIGLPAHAIAGASAANGSSLTYSNTTQENRALIDYGLKPLLVAIESRLSLSDVNGAAWTTQVTPRGTTARFNLDALTRGDALQRAQVYNILVPLGILSPEQAAALEDLAPTPGVNR